MRPKYLDFKETFLGGHIALAEGGQFVWYLHSKDSNDNIINPYYLLPISEITVSGQKIEVREGGGAMVAYRDMLYGINKDNDEVKALYKMALKKYCKLDTLSMVCIWQHWMETIF